MTVHLSRSATTSICGSPGTRVDLFDDCDCILCRALICEVKQDLQRTLRLFTACIPHDEALREEHRNEVRRALTGLTVSINQALLGPSQS